MKRAIGIGFLAGLAAASGDLIYAGIFPGHDVQPVKSFLLLTAYVPICIWMWRDW